MGSGLCGEDFYKKLVKEHGQDFLKLILAQKSKGVIKEKYNELLGKSNEKFDDFQAQTNSVVDKKSNQLASVFDNAKKSVDSTIPGGIAMIERIKGESVSQFSGYNKLQSSIDNIKGQTMGKVKNERNAIVNELGSKKNGMINKIQAQRPKIPIYEEMPDLVKKEVMKKGEKQFKKQITENKDKMGQEALKMFNPQILNGFFSNVNPESQLQSIIANAFKTLTSNISGASGTSGGLSGFVSGLF